jgi:hypothetical protein
LGPGLGRERSGVGRRHAHLEDRGPDTDALAVADGAAALQALARHEGPIGRAQVLDGDAVALQRHGRVAPRGLRVVEHDARAGIASDHRRTGDVELSALERAVYDYKLKICHCAAP